ncbi:hypothetical protein MAPG_07698 [Magnaporthiopsis poae ATCC 64411]|uniref:DUF3835 domain-containing protein n=1 Tax=Magnaporthiopsis poae (strain ATCC 64411 / 73-15) TaxID=644358 RepID=A0A0C4E5D2_MAGP6|nr:hypothetical protein MAPG_07698 [Magnaporthiopsis poae ATCC 64411]
MAPIKDSFLDLERHRHALEENAEKLRGLLQQWRLWDAEYEALKEEVAESRGPGDLVRIRRDFEGELVTGKEVAEIFGGKTNIKPAEQIVSQLDRRLDYVQRNIDTLEKQLRQAEDKAAVAGVVSAPDVRDDDGLPITDIVEELDDDDNVVSYRLQVPSDSQPQVREALKKAGVTVPEPSAPEAQGGPVLDSTDAPAGEAPVGGDVGPSSAAPPAPVAAKKTVSFGEGTKPEASASASTPSKQPQPRAQNKLEEIMHLAKEQEAAASQPAVIPETESPEDAALRRDMLAYSMSEIAPVVAELELEEGYSDEDDDEMGEYDYFYDEDAEDDEDDDEEDSDGDGGSASGRGKRRNRSYLSQEYRQRMLELEKKLGVSAPASVKACQYQEVNEAEAEAGPRIGRVTVAGSEHPAPPQSADLTPGSAGSGQPKLTKGNVRFARNLDIADEASQPKPTAKQPPRKQSWGGVVERGGATTTSPASNPAQAPGRFLEIQERRTAPSGPEGQTIAMSIVERQPATTVREPHDLDANLLHQEAAVEYQRMRNKLIHKGGGFLKEDTSAIVPLDEAEGGPKRVSRFKAARLSKQ